MNYFHLPVINETKGLSTTKYHEQVIKVFEEENEYDVCDDECIPMKAQCYPDLQESNLKEEGNEYMNLPLRAPKLPPKGAAKAPPIPPKYTSSIPSAPPLRSNDVEDEEPGANTEYELRSIDVEDNELGAKTEYDEAGLPDVKSPTLPHSNDMSEEEPEAKTENDDTRFQEVKKKKPARNRPRARGSTTGKVIDRI